jgi:hypothetical protein
MISLEKFRKKISRNPVKSVMAGVLAGMILTETGKNIKERIENPVTQENTGELAPLVELRKLDFPSGTSDFDFTLKQEKVEEKVDLKEMYDNSIIDLNSNLGQLEIEIKTFEKIKLESEKQIELYIKDIENQIVKVLEIFSDIDMILDNIDEENKNEGKEKDLERVENVKTFIPTFQALVEKFDQLKLLKKPAGKAWKL